MHQATFVETTVTQHWYENLLSGNDINFSGGDINDISFTPLEFEDTAENEDEEETQHTQENENEEKRMKM